MLPCSRIRKIIPLKQSSIAIAIQTPCNPIVADSNTARVIRTTQMLPKFMEQGIRVSPAPTKTPYATMLAANMGSAKASIRSTCVVSC